MINSKKKICLKQEGICVPIFSNEIYEQMRLKSHENVKRTSLNQHLLQSRQLTAAN